VCILILCRSYLNYYNGAVNNQMKCDMLICDIGVSLYSVLCPLYSALCILYSVPCALYFVLCTM
jgi:hypothetical protein